MLRYLCVTLFLAWIELSYSLLQKSCVRYRAFHQPTRYLSMEFDWKGLKKKADDSFKKSTDALSSNFNSLRAGAANPAILDRVFVESFGAMTPLNQLARVGTSGSQQIVIEPFDKSTSKDIEKAISVSNLNLTPTSDGGTIRINVRYIYVLNYYNCHFHYVIRYNFRHIYVL